jgi:N-methylhydantoinase B/oxoprolinase/acetone carboxylase alpha subunit
LRTSNQKIDPITLEVVRGGLISLCNEMGIAMMKSAYSPVFSEGLDYSYAFFDGSAEMITQAAFDPCHLGAMPYSVRASVKEIGLDRLEPGDLILHNDPYNGGSHISDFTATLPIFYKGEIVAMPAARGHQIDSGASVPGGFSGDAREIYEEGLRIPPVKVAAKGIDASDIWKLILANVRVPHAVEGDLRAMFGALKIGEKRITQFLDKYGTSTWKNCLDEIKNVSEKTMRDQIDRIPDGTYEYEDYIDDTGRTSDPARIHVRVDVKGDELFVDFSGSSPQVPGPINASFAVTAGNTVIGVLHSIEIGGDYVLNQGTFRPVHTTAPKGTIVNPEYPAPVQGGNTELAPRIVDAIIGALAQAAAPVRIKASCHGTSYGMTVGGKHNETNEPYIIYLWSLGGQGARAAGDGNSAMLPFATNNKGPVIEVDETRFPIMYQEYSLLQDSAGAGRYRGGIGTRLVWKLRAKECELSCLAERHRISPYGVFGGLPPMPRECGHFSDTRLRIGTQNDFGHATELFGKISPSKWSNITIHEGDSVEVVLSGGGGWGSPYEREPEAVLADVINGFVSIDAAKHVYGVVIDSQKIAVDTAATKRHREEMKVNGTKIPRESRVKMLQTLRIEGELNSRAMLDDVEDIAWTVTSGKQRQDPVVRIEAADCQGLQAKVRSLEKRFGAGKVRVLATQFVPSDFHVRPSSS